MDAAIRACAPSGMTWNGINWPEVQRQVRRLQTRIVKATQEGNHGTAKALQWLLTHSFSGKALAVKRVTENKGKNTAGVDKVTWKTPVAKTNAIRSLKRRGYSPLPLRRVYIPKKNGKTRPLGYNEYGLPSVDATRILLRLTHGCDPEIHELVKRCEAWTKENRAQLVTTYSE